MSAFSGQNALISKWPVWDVAGWQEPECGLKAETCHLHLALHATERQFAIFCNICIFWPYQVHFVSRVSIQRGKANIDLTPLTQSPIYQRK